MWYLFFLIGALIGYFIGALHMMSMFKKKLSEMRKQGKI